MTVIKFQLRFMLMVIDPETGEFITDEFRILEDVEFPAIECVGAVGEDGFYVNATHEYDSSIKYSAAINGSNNYGSSRPIHLALVVRDIMTVLRSFILMILFIGLL